MTAPHWVEEYFAPPGPALLNESTGTIHNVVTTEGPARRRNHRFTGVAPTITGFASGATSRPITIFAVGGPIVLKHENTGSLAANRISTPDGTDFTVAQNAVVELVYDGDSTRWRVASGAGSSGGGTGGPGVKVTIETTDADIELDEDQSDAGLIVVATDIAGADTRLLYPAPGAGVFLERVIRNEHNDVITVGIVGGGTEVEIGAGLSTHLTIEDDGAYECVTGGGP